MSIENRIRQIKGGLLFVTFFAVGIALYLQKGTGTIVYIEDMLGINPNIIVAGFIMSAFACLWIGWSNHAWNLLWYSPYVIYTGATWLAVSERIENPSKLNSPPIVAACFYTMLLCFLVIDWYSDWKGRMWINRTQLAS